MPVKVGVVLSLFGVGFLVKEGIDREWLVLPLELRLMFVALFGIGLLVLGWRLRARQRTYALSVQGGGIGVLYLTIYASFGSIDLLPATLAFALLVAVTAAAGVLAVLQDARALAVLGILGGFLAPVLVSTGSGNHVALFSYYALLNLAIVGIAWFKAWRVLNVLGFVFTFGIGTLWGIDGYAPEKFATTEPFLVLFTLMYLVIPVLFAMRAEPKLRGFVDGTLMFGTPIVAFALAEPARRATRSTGSRSAPSCSRCSTSAWRRILYRSQRESLRVLVEAQLALGVAFVTVAVPLALDARWTSAAWALQGAALVWLAFRQQRKLALLAGLALQALSGVAYVEQVARRGRVADLERLLSRRARARARRVSSRRGCSTPTRERQSGASARCRTGSRSCSRSRCSCGRRAGGSSAGSRRSSAASLRQRARRAARVRVGDGAARDAARSARRRGRGSNWLGVTLWPFAASARCRRGARRCAHPAEDFGWLAWPVVVGSMLWFLRAREALFPRLARRAARVGVLAGRGARRCGKRTGSSTRAADGVWPEAAVLALGAALTLATLRAATAVAWPFAAHARTYVQAGCGAVLAALTLATFALNVESAGEAAPLPYVPLVNPLELASVLVRARACSTWLGALGRQNPELAVAARARPAVAGCRGLVPRHDDGRARVHHWARRALRRRQPRGLDDVPKRAVDRLGCRRASPAMLVGARSLRRSVWLVGAALMSDRRREAVPRRSRQHGHAGARRVVLGRRRAAARRRLLRARAAARRGRSSRGQL